jgi:D-alanyl-D-alanine carboxypeptidase
MEIFRKYRLLLPLLICTCIVLVMGVILIWPTDGGGEETETESETQSESEVGTLSPEPPTFRSDLSDYESYMNAASKNFLILVNKQNTINADYIPDDLISVKDAKKNIDLVKTAAMALEAMFIEMRAEGFNDVFVTSAYRSYTYQSGLFETYINQEMAAAPSITREEAKARVLRYSAYPGTSEHQTGLCVDLMTNSMRELDETFADHPVYDWLCENAWKFGFILRFPADKVSITGYDFEPWHYRFVGRQAAYEIHAEGLCLEEYLSK